ncbi:hypothetical protein N7G274_002999 [Stereocaulon virgatum]|uniref:Queuosine 5'-phosphate N-glycosylase/hydrolase n=1 Tax=Stereocaulon virgatum TaxID=373712 RepID=A0ABR4AEN6_9LECA
MSDDEVDEDLLALLRKSLGIGVNNAPSPAKTGVLGDAEYVYDNSTDVALDMRGTKAAAASVWGMIQEKDYSTRDWSKHELHPKAKNETTVDFIFIMDLLNFSFWSEGDETSSKFAVEYRGKRWTGYWSLVAALQRALDEGIPITSPSFWVDEEVCTDVYLKYIFRSATGEEMPMLQDRIYCMREAGYVLQEKFDGSFVTCLDEANGSAAALVNLMADNFPCLDDRHRFDGRTVRFHKRPQILVADIWACFEGESFGYFHDINQITMFPDYRIPQMLHCLGCLQYSPPLESHIRSRKPIESGHSWELQLRGCSIWCVELLRREILRQHPGTQINAILIDFLLYDTVKEMEEKGVEFVPHHRTRSIWY